jgi:hypothetical protein
MRRAAGICILAGGFIAFAWADGAMAEDADASCCVSLDQRISELEAVTARKGNRKVSLAVSGQVNKAILFWDDGAETNGYVVGNKNDQTSLSFTGEATISPSLKAGYHLDVRLLDTLSDAVDQQTSRGGDGFFVWHSQWWVESKQLGTVSVGLVSRVSDTAPEADLSETGVAGYAGVQDIGGAFGLRTGDGSLSPITWGDLYNHFNGDTANLVRYDSPELAGLVASASFGEDDVWDIGFHYGVETAHFHFDAAVAYTEVSDGDNSVIGNALGLDQSTIVGSLSALHHATGLNFTFAAGKRSWDDAVVDLDGISRRPKDTCFVYSKLGWLAQHNHLGPTAYYGEYGLFEDFVSATDQPDFLDTLDASGTAARIAGNTAEVWGLGVVQHIDAAEMQIYVGYRHHTADFDLVDAAGREVASHKIDAFDTVVAGSKVAF